MKKGVNILSDEIKSKLTTRNIYRIFNQFIFPMISNDEREFLREVEDYMLERIEPSINLDKDVYELFKILGKKNYIQRLNPYGDLAGSGRYGMRYELLLAMATSIVDPELDLARVVTGVIFGNPVFKYGGNKHVQEILDQVLKGEKIGCICITERERGSDAVHMRSTIEERGDYLLLNAEKVYTTNGPVADYFIVYGVTDIENPRGTMYQVIVEREFEGIETYRLGITSIPRVQIGQSIFKNVKVPKGNVLGGRGGGYTNLFTGLVAERDAIVGSSLGVAWLTAITALIYTNLREQFGQRIYQFQGIYMPITQLFTELMAATELGLQTGDEYRKTLKYPDKADIHKYNAAFSSGTKFLASNLAHKINYEMQQLIGGIAFTDNLRVEKALAVSHVQEIIGGSRNIQLILTSRALRDMVKSIL
ncbi:MAG: acyl-CoA dehydrogenase [Candidatus Lokiarchaeota archaeon]|nr:acyl-CoA dehydrogenase [Candidatus Lokiarchaeota archaeon]